MSKIYAEQRWKQYIRFKNYVRTFMRYIQKSLCEVKFVKV